MPFNPDDLIAAKLSSDKKPQKKGTSLRSIVAGGVLIVAGLSVIMDQHKGGALENALTNVVAKISKDLPKPYGHGLIVEKIVLEGRNVVLTIRNPNLTLERATESPALLEKVHKAEQYVLLAGCGQPDIQNVLDRGARSTRRFVDANGSLLFEVSLQASDCRHRPAGT